MHRPTLILRRFGPLTFGLGYYHDGIWVDHLATDVAKLRITSDDDPRADSERVDPTVVHEWYSCCLEAAAEVPIATDALEREMARASAQQ